MAAVLTGLPADGAPVRVSYRAVMRSPRAVAYRQVKTEEMAK